MVEFKPLDCVTCTDFKFCIVCLNLVKHSREGCHFFDMILPIEHMVKDILDEFSVNLEDFDSSPCVALPHKVIRDVGSFLLAWSSRVLS